MNPILHIDGFEGVARLFPLPNFVMMPHVLKTFHIFEPRYRDMVADALKLDKLITMVLPREGWDKNYDGSFGVHSIGCISIIQDHQKLDDGRYNLVLRGICRVELEHEVLSSTLYRQAKVKLLPDMPPQEDAILRTSIEQAVLPWLSVEGEGREQFLKLVHSNAALGTIVDVVGFALPLPADWKQELLETLDVSKRVQRLNELLHSVKPFQLQQDDHGLAGKRPPPDFSLN